MTVRSPTVERIALTSLYCVMVIFWTVLDSTLRLFPYFTDNIVTI